MDRLTAGAFDQVVFGAHDNEAASARVESPGDFDYIRASDVFGVGQRFALQQPNERLVAISLLVAG